MSIVFFLLFFLIFSFSVRLEKRNEFGSYSLFLLLLAGSCLFVVGI